MRKCSRNYKRTLILLLSIPLIVAIPVIKTNLNNRKVQEEQQIAAESERARIRDENVKAAEAKKPKSLNEVFEEELTVDNLINETNLRRQQNGLTPLKVDPRLNASATAKCNDMVDNKYFAHTSPGGVEPWHWITQEGINYAKAGENLLFVESVTHGKPVHAEFLDMWMESPSHRDAILDQSFTHIGIGICYQKAFISSKIYSVQHFTGY